MNIIELIEKKKQAKALTNEEWAFVVSGYLSGAIPDYQMSALLMAVYFTGMSVEETVCLTDLTVKSGDRLDFSDISSDIVDKHSTGGVGDKITLILLPLLSAAGVVTAKLSGRGLGKTGGTIDKLESIPGFRAELSSEEFANLIRKNGVAISAQTKNLTPADGKMYALRDITATIDIIPLIACSIVSKKIASGANHIILDVKCGEGAFMTDIESAKKLAVLMQEVGKRLGRNFTCVITNMSAPLGRAVGNAVEVEEVIEFLKGNSTFDLEELVYEQATIALIETHKFEEKTAAKEYLKKLISSGAALEKFKEIISAQGGDTKIVDDYTLFPKASCKIEITSPKTGYVSKISALNISKACKMLGAGRIIKNAPIDYAAGVYLNKKQCEYTNEGETIATLYYNKAEDIEQIKQLVVSAFEFSQSPVEQPVMIYKII